MNKYEQDEQLMLQLKHADDKMIKSVYDSMKDEFTAFIISYFNTDKLAAEEIYPESFSKFYYNIKDGKLNTPLKSSLKTYLFAIAKRIYMKNHFGNYNKKIELKDSMPEIEQANEVLEHYEYDAQKTLVSKLLDLVGESCKRLLEMIYIEEIESQLICEQLNLNSLGTLRKRKFDCMKKMRSLYYSNNS